MDLTETKGDEGRAVSVGGRGSALARDPRVGYFLNWGLGGWADARARGLSVDDSPSTTADRTGRTRLAAPAEGLGPWTRRDVSDAAWATAIAAILLAF